MEDLNTLFDDVTEEVVTPQEPETETEEELELEEPESETEEVAEPQTVEENRKFAEFRRKQEAEIARIAGEKEAAEQRALKVFSTTIKGQQNPYNGKTVETYEDYEEYLAQKESEALQTAGLPADYIEQAINNHPTIRELKQARAELVKVRGEIGFNAELAEIQKLNPKIRSIDDLVKETKDDVVFQALQRGGMPLSQAYAHTHKMPQPKPDTKAHLQTVGGGNPMDASEPPKETLQTYLSMGFTKDEAVKHWRKEGKR